MVDCRKTGGEGGKGQQVILPVFYFITPRDVRHPDSGPYKEAFEVHNQSHDPVTISGWKEALKEVGVMKGWHVTETDGQGAVMDEILIEVESHLRDSYALVTDDLVGIDLHVEEVLKLLNLDSASEKIVGIHGIGGLGKTTLMKAVYNKVSAQFERCCFLENIRDTLSNSDGALTLQNKIISDILRKDSNKPIDAYDGIRIIRERVCRHKLLIVLDDVDERFQFEDILGKLGDFYTDSRFLITTRDARVLELLQECKFFELEEMSHDHSLKLLSKQAFGLDYPPDDYVFLSKEFVRLAAGLPLALKVIGSLLFRTNIRFWEEKLCELKDIPPTKRSLVKIDDENRFQMHDHVRDLGRNIVREENNQNPYKRSRIWVNRDAINMLKHREGTDCVEALKVDMKGEDYVLTGTEFKQLSRLRYLVVSNGRLAGNFKEVLPNIRWLRLYRCDSVPTYLNLKKLVILDFQECSVRDSWDGWKGIKVINLFSPKQSF
ncbi:Disease resistance protein L6 [Linum perenne]